MLTVENPGLKGIKLTLCFYFENKYFFNLNNFANKFRIHFKKKKNANFEIENQLKILQLNILHKIRVI